VEDLQVLVNHTDPYYFGTFADWEQARWFAALWEQYGTTGHLRRLYYQAFTHRPITPKGHPYGAQRA
jgi:hypothetical protein